MTNVSAEMADPYYEKQIKPGERLPNSCFSWKFHNLPVVKSEPYMTTRKDYLAAIYFQLVHYRDPYNYFRFIKEWDDFAKMMRDHFDDFIN
ncbi:hypothetical protein JW960_04400 [candidate division KSB1 bacterium]|nr:hypothetical protein [candidate division KSB1 bacterium]